MVFSPNSLAFAVAFLGIVGAGVKATLANASYQPHELTHQLKDSGAYYIFVYPAMLATLLKSLETLKVSPAEVQKRVIVLSYSKAELGMEKQLKVDPKLQRFTDLLKHGKLDQEEKFEGAQTKETILLCYSSGTTGLAKGVETTHSNMQAVTQITEPFYAKLHPKTDIGLAVLPFFHIFGSSMVLLFHLTLGIPLVVIPKFDPELFCKLVAKYKVTTGGIVPPILVVLNAHPAAEKYDLSSLRFLVSGAAPLGPQLVQKTRERFAKLGNKQLLISQGYGLTETSPTTHLLSEANATRKAGWIGQLLPNLEARLVGDDDRDVKPSPDAPGELWIRGPIIMKGYLNNEKATKESITPDGWFKTGDIAVRDDEGFFKIVDRKKELIKYKGFQVPPADLEAVLISHPKIADVAVIGIYSEKEETELPRAYVVAASNNAELLKDRKKAAAFGKEIQDWVKTQVAHHKYLRGGVVVIEAVPKSATGKILRKDLRALLKSETDKAKSKL